MKHVALVVFLILVLVSACSSDPTETTLADPSEPSDAVRVVDEELRAVPAGVEDCGLVNLASGWPTTTAFVGESGAACILDAAGSGEPAQMAFTTRDGTGGLEGWILGVDGADDLWETTYHVFGDGTFETGTVRCSAFVRPEFGIPTCASP